MPGRTEKKRGARWHGTPYNPVQGWETWAECAECRPQNAPSRDSRGERDLVVCPRTIYPLPSSYVYLHVYVSKDGGKDTSTRLSLVHPCCFHSKRSDKPLILFIKREINIAFALSAKTEGVLYAKRERERGAKIGECGRWTFKTDRVSPSTPV